MVADRDDLLHMSYRRTARAVVFGMRYGVEGEFYVASGHRGAVMPPDVRVQPKTPNQRCLIPCPAIGDGIHGLEVYIAPH